MTKEEEINLIKKIIDHPAGFNIELFTLLRIRSHIEGYEVAWDNSVNGVDEYNKEFYRDFVDLDEAVKFFVDKRYELQLGLDIEAQLMKESKNE